MRSERIVGAIGLCLCLSGCRLAADAAHNLAFETCLFANDVKGKVYYPMLAHSAWNGYRLRHRDKARSTDFACGFKEGYADYLENGGDGSSHPLPPIRYWKIHKETPEGREATERWLAGFREGAAVARRSGKRELIVVPVGGEAAPPPNGPPPGPPHPDLPPPAEPTDPLPPPRQLSAQDNSAVSRIEPAQSEPAATDASSSPPDREIACYPPPKVAGQTAEHAKEESYLPPIATGGNSAAAPPVVEVPLPPRDQTPGPAREVADYQGPKVVGQTGKYVKEENDLPRIVTGGKAAAAPSALEIPWPLRDQMTRPTKEAAGYQGPKVVGQTAEYAKEENDLPRIVTGGKPAATPSVSEVPLPPRDKTPRSAEVQYQVAMVAMRAGASEKALTWLYSALREDPNHVPSHKALMEYYQKTGDFLRAAEHRVKAQQAADSEADQK